MQPRLAGVISDGSGLQVVGILYMSAAFREDQMSVIVILVVII